MERTMKKTAGVDIADWRWILRTEWGRGPLTQRTKTMQRTGLTLRNVNPVVGYLLCT